MPDTTDREIFGHNPEVVSEWLVLLVSVELFGYAIKHHN